MTDDLGSLSEDDVERLVRIMDALEASAFDFLQLEVGEMKVTLGKGGPPSAQPVVTPAPVPAIPAPTSAPPPAPGASPAPPADSGTVEVLSPIMGLFYAQPEPGADPFVQAGTSVDPDTTVALVEVMKTFNAVPACVTGVVVEVCVENHQLVEYGQVLFRVRTDVG